MRKPSEVQSKLIEKVLAEFDTANLTVTENFVSLVQGSPTEDIFWFIRAEKGFEIYVYEDGEADIRGPKRKRTFEKPDFDSESEMADAIVEEVISQARFDGKPGKILQKLEDRRTRSQTYALIVIAFILLIFFAWRYGK